jgi:hypothetical protein
MRQEEEDEKLQHDVHNDPANAVYLDMVDELEMLVDAGYSHTHIDVRALSNLVRRHDVLRNPELSKDMSELPLSQDFWLLFGMGCPCQPHRFGTADEVSASCASSSYSKITQPLPVSHSPN